MSTAVLKYRTTVLLYYDTTVVQGILLVPVYYILASILQLHLYCSTYQQDTTVRVRVRVQLYYSSTRSSQYYYQYKMDHRSESEINASFPNEAFAHPVSQMKHFGLAQFQNVSFSCILDLRRAWLANTGLPAYSVEYTVQLYSCSCRLSRIDLLFVRLLACLLGITQDLSAPAPIARYQTPHLIQNCRSY